MKSIKAEMAERAKSMGLVRSVGPHMQVRDVYRTGAPVRVFCLDCDRHWPEGGYFPDECDERPTTTPST